MNAVRQHSLKVRRRVSHRLDRSLKHEARYLLSRVGRQERHSLLCFVRDGVVTVTGAAGDFQQRRKVIRTLSRADGVRRIRNRVKLRIGNR